MPCSVAARRNAAAAAAWAAAAASSSTQIAARPSPSAMSAAPARSGSAAGAPELVAAGSADRDALVQRFDHGSIIVLNGVALTDVEAAGHQAVQPAAQFDTSRPIYMAEQAALLSVKAVGDALLVCHVPRNPNVTEAPAATEPL